MNAVLKGAGGTVLAAATAAAVIVPKSETTGTPCSGLAARSPSRIEVWLTERGRLLSSIAPHLVEAQPFLWPLKMPVIERAYSAVGVGLYDILARIGSGGKKTVPIQKHLSKAGALARFPEIKPDALIGAIEFYDARVDDARLVITLIRTAQKYGAEAASRVRVTEVLKDDRGHASGVKEIGRASCRERV